jgi:ribonuclease HI
VDGEAVDFTAPSLDEDVVLLTYRITGSRPTLRSSVWLRTPDGWQMRFNQGTLLKPQPAYL